MRFPSLLDPPTPQWKAAIKRIGDLLVVYGHGLLAFGVGKVFTGALDGAAGVAVFLGVAGHVTACYISSRTEA